MLRQPFSTTNAISLWYAPELGDGLEFLPDQAIRWNQIHFTGESFSAHLTSAVSESIGKSETNSTVVLGEVSGDIQFEVQANTFLRNALVCVLMDETHDLEFGYAALDRSVLRNGSRRHPLVILKRIDNGDGNYDCYLYLGVEIDSLSLTAATSSLVTGSVSLFGRHAIPYLTASALPSTWTFVEEYRAPLMSAQEALKDFGIGSELGRSYPAMLQNLTVTINNQLRQQHTVGHRRIFPEGLGVGRVKVTYSGSAYYSSQSMLQAMLDDDRLSVTGRLWDTNLGSVGFLSRHVKPLSHRGFTAEAAEQDLVHELDLQAFQDDAGDTVTILVGQGREICGPITYFKASDGTFFLASDGKPVAFVTYCVGDHAYYLTSDGTIFADSDGKLILVDSHRHFDMEGAKLFLSTLGRLMAA